MKLNSSIGGYLPLEPPKLVSDLHRNGLRLNSARHGFEYLLTNIKPKLLYMPSYTCPVMFEIIDKTNIDVRYYEVDDSLETVDDISLNEGEYILYTNYYGVKNDYCKKLRTKYGNNLILDLAQALFYYEASADMPRFYSPRKFVGVPDGGILYPSFATKQVLDIDPSSHIRVKHLTKSIDKGVEAAYNDFQIDEETISSAGPVLGMSKLTTQLLSGIDFEYVSKRRNENFMYLHRQLRGKNLLFITGGPDIAPLVYPYRSKKVGLREYLIDKMVYTATYWPELLTGNSESAATLSKEIIALPIDQRYTIGVMKQLIIHINNFEKENENQ